jgi:DNA-binding transcriptional regulator LsrR (DeoR family)
MNCLGCGRDIPFGPRCPRCTAEAKYGVNKVDAAMLLLHESGLSYAKIARTYGISRSRVGQRVQRARARA